MSDHPGRPLRFWLVAGVAVLILALLLQSTAFKEFLDGVIHWAEGNMKAHPVKGAVVFFLFSGLSAMVAFASSVVLVPSAILAWGKPVTFCLLWGGWIAGAATAFGIGRLAGPLVVRMGYREKLEKYQVFVSRRMGFRAALVFCLAVPSEIPGYLFGGLNYPFFKFLAAIAIAESFYAVGTVYAGDQVLTAESGPLILIVGGMVALAVAAGFGMRAFKKRRMKANSSR
jgi:uncharacterized membrane protein YdjX (TVP38/TMEM64 family)